MKKARAAGFFAVATALVAGILVIPTPLRVQGTLVLTASKPAIIYAEVTGRLVELGDHNGRVLRDGDWVNEGDLIAKLSNPEKQRERAQIQEQHDVNYVKARWYGQNSDLESRGQAKSFDKMATDLLPALEKVNEQIAKLMLIAPRDGQVMGLPHPETLGQWLKTGKPFCEIGDPHKLEAHLILDQGDIDLIAVNHRAWIKIYGDSEVTWKSYVGEVAKRNRDEIPPELSNLAGGEIATKQDQKTGTAKPISPVYEVIIPIDNPKLKLQPGLRGFAKIDGGIHTLGWWLWRLITKTFHFTL